MTSNIYDCTFIEHTSFYAKYFTWIIPLTLSTTEKRLFCYLHITQQIPRLHLFRQVAQAYNFSLWPPSPAQSVLQFTSPAAVFPALCVSLLQRHLLPYFPSNVPHIILCSGSSLCLKCSFLCLEISFVR